LSTGSLIDEDWNRSEYFLEDIEHFATRGIKIPRSVFLDQSN